MGTMLIQINALDGYHSIRNHCEYKSCCQSVDRQLQGNISLKAEPNNVFSDKIISFDSNVVKKNNENEKNKSAINFINF